MAFALWVEFDQAWAEGTLFVRGISIPDAGRRPGPSARFMGCSPLWSNTRKTELPSAALTRVFLARLGARTAPFALWKP